MRTAIQSVSEQQRAPLCLSWAEVKGKNQASAHRIGGKAGSLLWLVHHGFPVPEWSALTGAFWQRFLEQSGLKADAEGLLQGLPDSSAGRGEMDADQLRKLERFRRRIQRQAWSPALLAEFHQVVQPLLKNGPIAVRSSGALEDMDQASFAGQYETILNVESFGEAVRAVARCWASAFQPGVLTYARDKGLPLAKMEMAVLLQRMVQAKSAGVLFSVNPMSGRDDEVLIEACRGLGDSLVTGTVDPSRYLYHWRGDNQTGKVQSLENGSSENPILSGQQVKTLAQIAVSIQAQRGRPVDVEWAWDHNGLWILQSRPITRIHFGGIEGEWTTADLKDGGVSSGACTPLMASLYQEVFNDSLPAYLDGVGLTAPKKEEQPWMRVFAGRPYWNVGYTKQRLQRLPGFHERRFDQDLGIAIPYSGEGRCTPTTPFNLARGLMVLARMKKSFRKRLAKNPAMAPGFNRQIQHFERLALPYLPDRDLAAETLSILQRLHPRIEKEYFYTIYDNSNAQTLFQEKLNQLYRKGGDESAPKQETLELLGGLENLSHLRPLHEEISLARNLKRNAAVMSWWRRNDDEALYRQWQNGEWFPGRARLEDYLQAYRHLAAHTLELQCPRWEEDPRPVFASLRRRLFNSVPEDPANSENRRQFLQKRAFHFRQAHCNKRIAALPPVLRNYWRRSFRKSLETTRDLLWWREEMRSLSTRVYYQIRRFCLEFGRRQVQNGILNRAEDVFFLNRASLCQWLRSGKTPYSLDRKLQLNQLYYRGFQEFAYPDEIGKRFDPSTTGQDQIQMPDSSAATMEGIAGSPGQCEGTARVISSLEQASRIQNGDILVTRFTDPGWTTYFSHLAGVITETGGVLSHAAVIARECGFPAVLALKDATHRIPDGARIQLDGGSGTVRVLEEQAA